MKNIFRLLIVALVFASCEDVEPVIYNGDSSNPTLLSFSSGTYDLPVLRGETGTATITLNSSTVSSVDRTYNLEFVSLGSTADPSTYTLPSTITIPAGSYQGTATINGRDNNLVEVESESFTFRLVGLTNEIADNDQVTVNVFEVCDLGADFTGDYRFSQITPPLDNGGTDIYLFEPNSIVTLKTGDNPYQRSFEANVWPSFFGSTGSSNLLNLKFSLLCDEVFVTKSAIQTGCTADKDFAVGRPTVRGTYTEGDDSVITVRVAEDANGSCLTSGARQVTFRLTKV
jgi:hypothetical protein